MLSPVYWDIRFYRITMFLLYGGSYASRYDLIFNHLHQKKVRTILELCFGDILLAEFCRNNQINWTGIDRNEAFVRYAKKKGFNSIKNDIGIPGAFPGSDIVVISGALYHFHDSIDSLLEKILKSTDQILISEHAINFETTKGLIGFLGGIISNAGNRNEPFRYSTASLKVLLTEISSRHNLQCHFIGRYKWDEVYLLSKK